MLCTHTHGILEKNINKIKGRDIYANASNFGITLIALIITIIVLLILAGVTLNMLMGENGIFGKANISKERTNYASAKEIINIELMNIETKCYSEGIEYNIKEIAKEMKEVENITIEKYYNGETASIKNGVKESLENLKGIVVSENDYSKYKFLIGETGKIEGVIEGKITEATKMEEFKKLEDYEKEMNKGNTGKDNNEEEVKDEIIKVPKIDESIDTSKAIEITTNMTVKVNSNNKIALEGIEGTKYEVEEKTNNITVNENNVIVSKQASTEDYCKIKVTGTYKEQSYTNHIKLYVEPKITTIEGKEGYEINNGQDLKRFAEIINNEAGSIKNAALMKDIDMSNVCNKVDGTVASDKSWEPIGNEKIEYNGIFEGNGHTINNIYINSNNSNQGLFGVVGENGKIKNIKINGKIETTGIFAGGITGVNNGTILKCSNNAEVVMNGAYDVGGITGVNNGTIMKCINQANISSRGEAAGGISGANGIVGTTGIIGECCNYGSIYAGSWNSAGISAACGTHNSGSIGYIFNCYNVGTITGGNGYNGGIVASCGYGGGSSYIYNCYNEGNIVCTQQGGSLIYENIYYTEVDITVDNLNKNSNIVQGLQEKNLYISNAFTSDTSNINNGYPILKWQLNN